MSNSSRLFFLCISLCLPFMMSCLKQASNTLQSSSAQVNIEIPYDKLQGKLTYYRLQVSSNNGEDCEVADTTSDSGGYVASNELLVRCFPYIFTLTLWKDNETDPEKYWSRRRRRGRPGKRCCPRVRAGSRHSYCSRYCPAHRKRPAGYRSAPLLLYPPEPP